MPQPKHLCEGFESLVSAYTRVRKPALDDLKGLVVPFLKEDRSGLRRGF